ncbi:hypothetical protein V8F20_007302 [Naviculisporaceae sp. PSN 640]
MAHIEKLGPELAIWILCTIERKSSRDLHSLISASPYYLRVFLHNRKPILLPFLRDPQLGPASYRDLLAISHILVFNKNANPPMGLFLSHLGDYFLGFPVKAPDDPAKIKLLRKIYNTVVILVELYIAHQTQTKPAPGSKQQPSSLPPGAERAQLQREFFRYELYMRLFEFTCFLGNKDANISAERANNRRRLFTDCITEDDVKELFYVQCKLIDLSASRSKDMVYQYADVCRSCPGLHLTRPPSEGLKVLLDIDALVTSTPRNRPIFRVL